MIAVQEKKSIYGSMFERFEQDRAGADPAWLAEIRNSAFARFSGLGFPTTRDEEWRYTNVGPIAATEFDELTAYLHSSLDLTIVMITHDLDTLFTVCDRVAVLVDGKAVVGPLQEVRESPHPWIRRYFSDPRAHRTANMEKNRGRTH